MVFELPELPYGYSELEPHFDKVTMEIHHTKHHQAYVDNLNDLLLEHPDLLKISAEELLKNPERIPEDIRQKVLNNAGGHLNHSFFWEILKEDDRGWGEVMEEIEEKFASFDNFKDQFTKSALGVFGSGWTWLVLDNGKLEIINTSGHENPISDGKVPLFVLDMWEHAYYLKNQNRKKEYIESFFKIANWDKVNELYLASSTPSGVLPR